MLCGADCDDKKLTSAGAESGNMRLHFGDDLDFIGVIIYDYLPDRYDPCRWFDSEMNKAVEVHTQTFTFNEQMGVYQISGKKKFLDGTDFHNGDPDNLLVPIPVTGSWFMIIDVVGEVDEDCCPGDPPGRPVYRETITYIEGRKPYSTAYAPRFHVLPEFEECEYPW